MKCRSVKPLFFFIGSPTYRHIMAGHNEHHHVLQIQDACDFSSSMECHCLNSALKHLQQFLGPL